MTGKAPGTAQLCLGPASPHEEHLQARAQRVRPLSRRPPVRRSPPFELPTRFTKIRAIGYWVATSVAALSFVGGGILDIVGAEDVVATMHDLGYPAYVAPLLGVWKLLGAAALLAPRFERLKEWAYAGMFFDLTGASISHAVVGDPLPGVLTPLVVLAFVLASWTLRPQNRRLAGRTPKAMSSEDETASVSWPRHAGVGSVRPSTQS